MKFPNVFAHRDARCFFCGGVLSDLTPTANAPGSGNFRGTCVPCGLSTWYDCAEGTVELIDLNESRERTGVGG